MLCFFRSYPGIFEPSLGANIWQGNRNINENFPGINAEFVHGSVPTMHSLAEVEIEPNFGANKASFFKSFLKSERAADRMR